MFVVVMKLESVRRQCISPFERCLVTVNLSCHRYTYGKPVPGHVKINVCRETETGCREVNSQVSESILRPVLNIQDCLTGMQTAKRREHTYPHIERRCSGTLGCSPGMEHQPGLCANPRNTSKPLTDKRDNSGIHYY